MSLPAESVTETKPVIFSLQEQRLALRRQLANQREIIARLIPSNQLQHSSTGGGSSYPRSLTMRLLRQNPAPVIKLAIGIATWLLGERFYGVFQEGVQFLKMVRTGAIVR